LERVSLTSWPVGTTGTVTPALAKAWPANFPHGTVGAHSTSCTPGFTVSASVLIFLGLPFATAISRRFRAKTMGGFSTSPAATSLSAVAVSAAAKTSTGAPCSIWVSRTFDAPKLNVTFVPRYLRTKS